VMARIVGFLRERLVPHFAPGLVRSPLAACGANTVDQRERAPPEALPLRRPSEARYPRRGE